MKLLVGQLPRWQTALTNLRSTIISFTVLATVNKVLTPLTPSFSYSLFISSLDIIMLCTQSNRMQRPYAMRLGLRSLDRASVHLGACSESGACSV